MKSTWIADYGNNKIGIENTWFNGEKLFVNDELQDEQINFFSANLTGHLVDEHGEKQPIKVNLSGFFSIGCKLFVGDKPFEAKQIQ